MKKLITICLVMTVMATAAKAGMIAEFDLPNSKVGGLAPTYYTPTVYVPRVSLSNLTETVSSRGSGVSNTLAALVMGWPSSKNLGKYYEFTLGPEYALQPVRLDKLTYALARKYVPHNDTYGAEDWQLQASLDGFATPGRVLATHDISSAGRTLTFNSHVAVKFEVTDFGPLGGNEFSGPVTFRMFGWGTSGPPYGSTRLSGFASGSEILGDRSNILFEGIVIPEPATLGLLLLGGLALLRQRR